MVTRKLIRDLVDEKMREIENQITSITTSSILTHKVIKNRLESIHIILTLAFIDACVINGIEIEKE